MIYQTNTETLIRKKKKTKQIKFSAIVHFYRHYFRSFRRILDVPVPKLRSRVYAIFHGRCTGVR